MYPTIAELRKLNQMMDRFSDNEIQDFIIFLGQNGFEWDDSKKIFFNNKLQYGLRTQGLDIFVRHHQGVKDNIKDLEAKYRESPAEYDSLMSELKLWKYICTIALVCGIGGLFLGKKIFGFKMWVFYEIFCFVGFIISWKAQAANIASLHRLKNQDLK